MTASSTTVDHGPDQPDQDNGLSPTGRVEALPWWASLPGFGWIMLVCAAGSMYGAVELTYERVLLYLDPSHTASCDVGGAFSCTTVMKSAQATVFGPPNPFIGLVGFTILVVIGVLLVAKVWVPRWFMNATLLGVAAATGFLVWLYAQAVYSIEALCLYCMVCWLFMGILFPVNLARNLLVGDLPAPKWLRMWARHGAWLTVLVLLLACAASILVVFSDQLLG